MKWAAVIVLATLAGLIGALLMSQALSWHKEQR